MKDERPTNANRPDRLPEGEPVQLTVEEAERLLLADIRAKADKGDAQSQLEFGKTFLMGSLGVAKDEVEAVKWLRKAAEQNYAEAQCRLGVFYYNGHGVPKDYVEAYRWALLAAARGHENAKKFMNILEERMSREQIAKGQELARSFKPRQVPVSGEGWDSLK